MVCVVFDLVLAPRPRKLQSQRCKADLGKFGFQEASRLYYSSKDSGFGDLHIVGVGFAWTIYLCTWPWLLMSPLCPRRRSTRVHIRLI